MQRRQERQERVCVQKQSELNGAETHDEIRLRSLARQSDRRSRVRPRVTSFAKRQRRPPTPSPPPSRTSSQFPYLSFVSSHLFVHAFELFAESRDPDLVSPLFTSRVLSAVHVTSTFEQTTSTATRSGSVISPSVEGVRIVRGYRNLTFRREVERIICRLFTGENGESPDERGQRRGQRTILVLASDTVGRAGSSPPLADEPEAVRRARRGASSARLIIAPESRRSDGGTERGGSG